MKKPLTPEEKLLRVLRIAKTNGLSVVIIAVLGTLISIGDWLGMAVGLAITIGGSMELSGRKQLLRGDVTGVRRLVQSQWVVLGAIELYCLIKLIFDTDHGVSQEMRSALVEMGIDMAQMEPSLRQAFYATYGAVALITLIYQGGMARYYGRCTAAVQEAIAARLRPPIPPKLAPDPEDWVT